MEGAPASGRERDPLPSPPPPPWGALGALRPKRSASELAVLWRCMQGTVLATRSLARGAIRPLN
eukprot:14506094-Alexandrium_andersonii.AAC.1